MTRIDGDTWDLASNVGTTATMVATARALASRRPDRLIDDPFAEPLVRAVDIEFLTSVLNGEVELAEFDGDPQFSPRRAVDLVAVRTRFFDEFFTAAGDTGIVQAVILASGLDSRAYRLPWPTGTVVYEIDQPAVIEFKTRTLGQLGASPTAKHRPVKVDLRDDWPAALRDNGFDDTQPTAWSAEGLLVYLPPADQDLLFDNITSLSATGSRLATEYHLDGGAAVVGSGRLMARHWGEHGFEIDWSKLVYRGDRNPVADYLADRGWHVSTQSRADLFTAYGRVIPEDAALAPLRNTVAVTATRQ
jgi:methyltransferase (TIGR00027 family)